MKICWNDDMATAAAAAAATGASMHANGRATLDARSISQSLS